MSDRKSHPWLVFVLASIIVILGLGGAYHDAVRKRNWPQADGTVVNTNTEARREELLVCYRLQIRYRYKPGNEEHHGDCRVYPWYLLVLSKSGIQKLRAEYYPGAPLKVYYNPNRPGESSLRRTEHPFFYYGCLPVIALGVIMGIRRILGGN